MTSLKSAFSFATGFTEVSIARSVSAYKGDNRGSEEGWMPL